MVNKHFPGFYKCFEHRWGNDNWSLFITHIRTNRHKFLDVEIRSITGEPITTTNPIFSESIISSGGVRGVNGFYTVCGYARKIKELKIPMVGVDKDWRCAVRG